MKKNTHVSKRKNAMPMLIAGTSVAALLVAFVFVNKTTVKQSVQGVSIVKGMYNEGMVTWQPVAGAVSYNIYYGLSSDTKFSNSVRQIPATATNYTIQYLKKNVSYKYQISAVGLDIHGNKTETWFSPIRTLTVIKSM